MIQHSWLSGEIFLNLEKERGMIKSTTKLQGEAFMKIELFPFIPFDEKFLFLLPARCVTVKKQK